MNAPGKGMLKVVSILNIIFGAIGTVSSAIGVFAVMAMASLATQLGGVMESAAAQLGEGTLTDASGNIIDPSAAMQGAVAAVTPLVIIALIIGIVGCLLTLIFGIIGVGKAGDPAKAGFFVSAGIILCIIQLVSIILTLASGGLFPVVSFIGFVLPILYIVGGLQNKNAVQTPAA